MNPNKHLNAGGNSVPTVSIVIPVYNGVETIGACLNSLLNQSYPQEAYEILVVDNGSTDATRDLVRRYPVRLLRQPWNGPSAARNFGIQHSQGEIVAFTDADCRAHPDWLARLVEPYADPQVGGVGGNIEAYVHPQASTVERFSQIHNPLVNFSSGEGEFLPHLYTANASYRRELLEAVGSFNAQLITAEDVDLSWRTQLQAGIRLEYQPEAIIYHHHRSTRAGLARQYRLYGFGEILLDTLYKQYPGYPRQPRYQVKRIVQQSAALPRYLVSAGMWKLRRWTGKASLEQAELPLIWLMIESHNVLGKLHALRATRWMTDSRPVLNAHPQVLLRQFFTGRKS